MAMALAKLYVVRAFRRVVVRHPEAGLAVFVDDVVVSADTEAGRRAHLQRVIVGAALDVVDAIRRDMRADIAMDKAAVVASHGGIALAIGRSLGLPAIASWRIVRTRPRP